jgi:hypothetical protein
VHFPANLLTAFSQHTAERLVANRYLCTSVTWCVIQSCGLM